MAQANQIPQDRSLKLDGASSEPGPSGELPELRMAEDPVGLVPRPAAPRLGLVAACAFPAPRGSQVLVEEMAAALKASGADVHLVAPVDERARDRSCRTHSVPPAVPRARAGGPTSLLRPIVDLSLAAALLRVTRREGLEVLHAHNYEGLGASLAVRALSGIPVVYHSHNVFADELPTYAPNPSRQLARAFGRWCDRTLPRLADHVVTLSADVGHYLVGCGVDPRRVSVIPPGLNPAPFEDQRLQSRAPRAIFAGNLDGYQNLDLLLDAWTLVESQHADSELVLLTHVRKGRAARRLRQRIEGRRVRLRIVHSLPEVAAELGSARLGISPRSSWSGFPIKTLNYMASGLPTVALAGSAKGVVHGETGWVVETETPAALANTLVEALDAPLECARRGRAAHQRLRAEHDWERLAPRILEAARSARTRRVGTALGGSDSEAFEADFGPRAGAGAGENPLN